MEKFNRLKNATLVGGIVFGLSFLIYISVTAAFSNQLTIVDTTTALAVSTALAVTHGFLNLKE